MIPDRTPPPATPSPKPTTPKPQVPVGEVEVPNTAPCGATQAAKCDGGQACTSADDCASGVCGASSKCLYAQSCNTLHGGSTCGREGSTEDCCTRIAVKVGAKRFALDKYNITAGRMRTFIEATNGNIRDAIAKNPPAWWDARWTAFLPADFTGNYNVYDQLGPSALYQQVSPGSQTFGCYLKGGGARSYWVPDGVSESYGDIAQQYPKDVLDEKPLNCASAVLVAALCAWDGGRLPTPEELDIAWGSREYPWGDAPAPFNPEYEKSGDPTFANHGNNYEFPPTQKTDATSHMAPPGRYPKGNGPFGHADLVGNVWNFTSALYSDGPYTPDPLRQWVEWTRGGAWEAGQFVPFVNIRIAGEPGFYPRVRAPMLRKYWAAGGRCSR
jgi:formylglycine-generating enzyme required for sulfatase activity